MNWHRYLAGTTRHASAIVVVAGSAASFFVRRLDMNTLCLICPIIIWPYRAQGRALMYFFLITTIVVIQPMPRATGWHSGKPISWLPLVNYEISLVYNTLVCLVYA